MKTAIAISPMMANVLSVAKIPPAAVTASQMARIAPRIVVMIRPMYPVCPWAPLEGGAWRRDGLPGRNHRDDGSFLMRMAPAHPSAFQLAFPFGT